MSAKKSLSPLAQESIKTQDNLRKILSAQQKKSTASRSTSNDEIHYKISFDNPLKGKRKEPGFKKATKDFLQRELKASGETTGTLYKSTLDTKSWELICKKINKRNLAVQAADSQSSSTVIMHSSPYTMAGKKSS